jgi:deoxyribodipyrimidine photo-lyase
MQKALFIFRRDLRLEDNTGLIYALNNADLVIPCFIFTPQQIDHNPYKSEHAIEFMIGALNDLKKSLKGKLFCFHGKPADIVDKCIKELGVDGVVVNRDYTPYSIERDKKISHVCKQHRIPFFSFDDALLHPPEATLKQNGQPYSVFTPYFRNASKLKVAVPQKNRHSNYYTRPIPFSSQLPSSKAYKGRTDGLKLLKSLKKFSAYRKDRDFPAIDATTHLSPHLKFTTCSPREVYAAIVEQLGSHSELIRALYWRDFFTTIAFFFPHVFQGAFHRKYDRLKWSDDKKAFHRWCEGKTGVPIVDAGMRQLNATGFMHNRVRMIAATFLVKDLHIDWHWGEKYFAQTLIDYDPSVNNGNWQWVASTGCDAQPYFRIFNPWTQAKKFDPDCTYIKEWIPELKSLSAKEIHDWESEKHHDKTRYPPPMISHAEESKKAIRLYYEGSKALK